MFKDLVFSGAINSDQILGPRVSQASHLLEEIIGPTAHLVTAEWRVMPDASNRQLLLVLSDFTGARVEARFAPEELTHGGHLRDKFYKIWGDLLEYRSHQQLNQLSGKIGVSGQ